MQLVQCSDREGHLHGGGKWRVLVMHLEALRHTRYLVQQQLCVVREGERREMENGDGRVGTAGQDWAGGRADFFNGRKCFCFLFPHACWVKKRRERRKGGRA